MATQPNKPMINKDLLAAARAALADRNKFLQSMHAQPRSPRNGRHRISTPQAHRDSTPASSARDDRTFVPFTNTITWVPIFPEPPAAPAIPHAGIRAGEIIGYRAWWVVREPFADRLRLRSLAHSHIWEPNAIEQGDTEKVVQHYLHWDFSEKKIFGGVYSFKTPELDLGLQARAIMAREGHIPPYYLGLAIGTIFCWGDVVEHETGWRASHAKLRSLDEIIGVPKGELREEYGV